MHLFSVFVFESVFPFHYNEGKNLQDFGQGG